MAAHSLLDALSIGGDEDDYDDTYVPAAAMPTLRRAAQRSSKKSIVTPQVQGTTIQPKRLMRNDSAAPISSKRQKIARRGVSPPTKPLPAHEETETSAATHTAGHTVGRVVTSSGIITDSSSDATITDTMARMRKYINGKKLFTSISATIRRRIVKSLKSTFRNRYSGRCNTAEGEEYIALWVELADAHNGTFTSEMERRSLGVEVSPKWRQLNEVIIMSD